MPKFVLIVEDSDTCSETLEIAFEPIPDLICRVARSEREALKCLADADSASAVITDLDLGKGNGGSGMGLIRKIREQLRFAKLPVFLITGDSDPDVERKALDAGATAFFRKPYSPAAVRRTLEALL